MNIVDAINTLNPVIHNGETFGRNDHYQALTFLIDHCKNSLSVKQTNNTVAYHHPGTDKNGHPVYECYSRGCK